MNARALVAVVASLFLAGAARAERSERDERRQVAVMLKGGVGTYTRADASAGPVWGVTVDLQPWQMLGLEVGYDGSLNPVPGSSSIARNGGTAMFKLSPPFFEHVKPFLGAGVGATSVNLTNGGPGGGLMAELPLAAGVEVNTRGLTAGIRGTYRVLGGNDLSRNTNFMDASATVGGWF